MNSDVEGWEMLKKKLNNTNKLWNVRTLLINIFNMVLTNIFLKDFEL